ncbi:DUF5906 domain-containing protein [Rhodopirellula sp. MGV]|uniref:DUF5906 domain-containing protein n=1 Tax=Rhodopirellula sp. MGV TaxID=2023130 RepID=UPI000B95F18A|nr:DUF5906 domain-containing protein [Rhodopirellula sp. MGV]OYP36781.1 hypothetical protein CGZ80_06945 [Rhodopirellula sp. MGV]
MLNPTKKHPVFLRYGKGKPNQSAVVNSRERLHTFLEGRQDVNVYFTPNRVSADCSKLFPGIADIERRTFITIDLDPVRPKGRVASDSQREEVAELSETVIESLEMFGWGWPTIVDTGNGRQIHYETDLSIDPATNEIVEEFFRALANEFDTKSVTIDRTAARLHQPMRVPGSMNVKAEPHRPCAIVRRWDSMVSLDDIKAAIEGLGGEVPGRSNPMTIAKSVGQYLEFNGLHVEIRDSPDIVKIEIKGPCPFKKDADQTDGNPAVLVFKSSGNIGFKCNHAKCEGKGWDTLQKTFPQTYTKWLHQPEKIGHDEFEITDPEVTVDRFLSNREVVTLDGKFYEFNGGWQERSRKEISAGLTLQARDLFASHHQKNVAKGSKQRRPTTSSRHTGDCVNLLTAITTSYQSGSSFYRVEHPWNARQVRRFENFDVNVHAYANGGADYFEPISPDLFTTQTAQCAFDPDAGSPKRYLEFLRSLEWTQEEIDYFQRVSGYVTFFPRDLQKIILACGPPRAGKGVESRLMSRIIGETSICSMTLDAFGSRFGLEDAIGKRLLLVNEASPPSPQVAEQSVAMMKAISGGDMVPVDRKGVSKVSTRLPMPTQLYTNHRLTLVDPSGALASRILPVEYRRSFVGNESEELEAGLHREIAAIAKWKLDGCRMLANEGWKFSVPSSLHGMLDEIAHNSSPMRAFVDDYFIVEKGYCVSYETVLGYYSDHSASEMPKGKLIDAVKDVDTLIKDGRLSKAEATSCKGCKFILRNTIKRD